MKDTSVKYLGSTNIKDITLQKFNRLTAIKFIDKRGKSGSAYWLFRCDCGKGRILRASAVRTGNTKSCGCFRLKDITGKKFDMLTAIRFSHRKNNITYWLFACDCGEIKVRNYGSVIAGGTKSCGCIDLKKQHGMQNTRVYQSWISMRKRCLSKIDKDYKNYGGRGITICEEWSNFKIFYADMGDRPVGMTIERRDNNLGYNKRNCVWATVKEQARNKRSNKNYEYLGETKCISAWAEKYSIHRTVLRGRLLKGLTVGESVNIPFKIQNPITTEKT